MDLFIYSDESGVFDRIHNEYFVFGGIICFGKDQKEHTCRKYSNVEKTLRAAYHYKQETEMKACKVSPKVRAKLYRSLNNSYKFCVLIKERNINQNIFENPKHKQRYLDYAYKLVLKKCIQYLVKSSLLNKYSIDNIYVSVDEHHTATDGLYELRENLLSEFKYGTYDSSWSVCYEPVFPALKGLEVKFCDSSKTLLVRAADIIANRFYHLAMNFKGEIPQTPNSFVYELPGLKIICTGKEFF